MEKEQRMNLTVTGDGPASFLEGVYSLAIKTPDGKTLEVHGPGYQGHKGFTIRSMPGRIVIKPDVSNVVELDVGGFE